MLVHEDPELEEIAVSGGFDVIVPISIYVPATGEAKITAYNSVWNICLEYEKRCETDLFDKSSLSVLCEKAEPVARSMGYILDFKESRVINEYRIKCATRDLISASENAVVIGSLSEIEGFECPLLHRPEVDDEDDDDVCAIVVKDGVLCSVAGINDYSDDNSIEIYVETAKEYRGHGYGSAAVAALSLHLVRRGYTVAYNCSDENTASQGIAKKLKMEFTGRRFSVICYAGDCLDG